MQKSKLFVFAGKPGAGKTTVIKRLFPGKKVIRIESFLDIFRIGQVVPDRRTPIAYKNLYLHLADLDEPEVVLEIGTNHPKLNISELWKLREKYEIKIFLCVAPTDTLCRRADGRGPHRSIEAFERRLQRDFPNTFFRQLKTKPLDFDLVYTGDSLKNTLKRIISLI